ncbi:hypothetical protein FA95DRAFT_1296763 [Auriscalpium vulgare]|uniref:Uncharacterized protein n=1 Tax=Auriscalpium vulgare TaxID=40419 RepID=A0ACB8RTB7_9AGAM|nr:hypothetical protein FA95DRAFT_1296763 [Auriscalpium vulgare]
MTVFNLFNLYIHTTVKYTVDDSGFVGSQVDHDVLDGPRRCPCGRRDGDGRILLLDRHSRQVGRQSSVRAGTVEYPSIDAHMEMGLGERSVEVLSRREWCPMVPHLHADEVLQKMGSSDAAMLYSGRPRSKAVAASIFMLAASKTARDAAGSGRKAAFRICRMHTPGQTVGRKAAEIDFGLSYPNYCL